MNPMNRTNKELSPGQREELLRALKSRFEKNMNRHKGLEWAKVQETLEADTVKLWSLNEMERTGGEPDVVGLDKNTGEYIFYDCSAQSPQGRRNVCYDREGQMARKANKPENNAIDMAAAMGIETFNGRTIPGVTETWKFRYKDVELGENTLRYQKTRRRPLC